MKILVIGGTRFVGRTLVETALKQGHTLTLFNRGISNPELFTDVEKITGDRDNDLSLLEGRKWNIVVDTCGYFPRVVGKSAALLKNAVERYIFISTLNVYADFSKPGIDENSPLGKMEDETVEQVTGETYGPLKVLCENAVKEIFPDRSIMLRCGLIVGPYDPTDRFTYWPVRIQQGGEVLCASPPEMQVQFIDTRDLANFILHLAEERKGGAYNTTGPARPLSMQEFLDVCKAQTKSSTSLTWVSEEFITGNDIGHIPMWTPTNWRGIFSADCNKAMKSGLHFRSIEDTVSDTLAWHATRPADYQMKVGLKRQKEKELLAKWHDSAEK